MKGNSKKLLCLLTLATLFLSIFSGCSGGKQGEATSGKNDTKASVNSNFNPTGLPIVKEPITLRLMVPHPPTAKKNFAEKEWFKQVAQKTNISIEWEEIAKTSFPEKFNLVINSGDLPDGVYNYSENLQTLGNAIDAGLLLPLDNYIDKYAPNQKKLNQLYPLTKLAGTYTKDSKMYLYTGLGLKPEAAARAPMFINKVWMDKLGLKTPTTTDELYTVLKDFKTKDPNGNGKADEIPVTFVKNGDNYQDMLAAWGILDTKTRFHTRIVNGKLVFNITDTKFRDAMRYFSKLYSEGLIDNEFLTQDSNQQKAKGSQNPNIIGFFTGYDNSKVGPNAKDFVVLPPLKGPTGEQLWPYNTSEFDIYAGLILFKGCKNPEAAVRWVDYLNDGVNAIINNFGPENVSWKRDEATKTWTTLDSELAKKGVALEEMVTSEGTQNGPQMSKVTEITGYKFVFGEGTRDGNKKIWSDVYKPFFNKEFWPANPPIFPASDDSKNIALLETDFESYYNTFVAEAITKGLDDQKWDAHIKKCKELQVDKILAYYQTMYDEVKKLMK